MRRISVIAIALAFLTTGSAWAQFIPKVTRSESVVHIDGSNYYIHSVHGGETIYSLAKAYDVPEDEITANNPLTREGLRSGQVLKIPVKEEPVNPRRQSKLFDEHIARAGETAYSIARNYGISVTAIVEDNPGVDPTQLPIGQVLNIRRKAMGETAPAEVERQWEEYRDAVNLVSDEYTYHIVKPGETIYSLSRMFGVSQQQLKDANQLDDGLKANSIIRIPAAPSPVTTGVQPAKEEPQSGITENYPQTDYFFREPRAREYRPGKTPHIALMLPLEVAETGVNNDFADFYRGALAALEDMKSAGHSLKMTLYNSGRSAEKVHQIVSTQAFSDIDLIIGPVYENALSPALQYAEAYNIPIVSPLASVKESDGQMLYQMAPDPSGKYDKLGSMLSGEKNIILVSSGAGDDHDFEREITGLLAGNTYGRFTLGESSGSVTSLIDWNRENVFVVLAGTELGVDKALASISSAYNNASRRADIRVIGSSKWTQYNSNSLDKTLFFKMNVCFVTSYYVNRSDKTVAKFETRFLETYGNFPSRSAYRGYDAVKLFGEALLQPGYSFQSSLSAVNPVPLQMPYRFIHKAGAHYMVNDQWALVCFQNDFNIVVK